jgi:hypothetical protein
VADLDLSDAAVATLSARVEEQQRAYGRALVDDESGLCTRAGVDRDVLGDAFGYAVPVERALPEVLGHRLDVASCGSRPRPAARRNASGRRSGSRPRTPR